MALIITENPELVKLGREASKSKNLIVIVPNKQSDKPESKPIPEKEKK